MQFPRIKIILCKLLHAFSSILSGLILTGFNFAYISCCIIKSYSIELNVAKRLYMEYRNTQDIFSM